MLIKTIFSGFGGQGVLSMGTTLATAAMLEGKYVTYLPAYGVEVRGGTANCTVVVADEEIASPVASEPEFVVAMNQPSFAQVSEHPSGRRPALRQLISREYRFGKVRHRDSGDPDERACRETGHHQGCQHDHAGGPDQGEQYDLL